MDGTRMEEREVARAVHRAFMERGELSAKAAASVDVPWGRIQKWATGQKQPRAWEVRHLLAALMAQSPEAAVVFLDELLGLRVSGLILAQAPRAESARHALVVEAAEAGAAVGAVQAAVLEAEREGGVSAEESQEIRALTRVAERRLVEVAAVAARNELARMAPEAVPA
ncbi:MAG: hypothetical protein IPL32_19145 [Chloracidobacterium sp.]|nr:hypothetical protein [Chloracidobacterium sp.]